MKQCWNGLLVIIILIYSGSSYSQQYFYNEKYYDANWLFGAGIQAGGMNALTDLGGGKGKGKLFLKDLNIRNTQPCVVVQLNFLYKYTIGIRTSFTHGKISSADSLLKNKKGASESRRLRNLHMRSPINEFTLQVDWHFPFSNKDGVRLSSYLTAGIGYFSFNPQAEWNGQWIDLAPLRTEGQGFFEYPEHSTYSLRQVNFPLGAGLQYEASAIVLIRAEILHRFLLTDYLDDVSKNYVDADLFYKYLPNNAAYMATQLADRRNELNPLFISSPNQVRGNPKRNDAYLTINIGATLILNRKKR